MLRTFLVFFFLNLFVFQGFSQRQIILQDSLNTAPIGWKFRNSSPHDWKWYTNEGNGGTGGLRMKLPNDSNYFASPKFTLLAGVQYTASFKTRVIQGPTTRKVSVGWSKTRFVSGANFFFDTYLPTNSYANPPFSEYNPTFSVPTNGDYYLIFYYEENGYTFTYFDDLIIEKTFLPTTNISFPTNNSNFNEGTDITITANAADIDGSIVKVEFFADGIKINEDLTAPYEFLWKDILPKDYQLTTKVTDNRGNATVSSIVSMRMNFKDGSFGKYVNWDFNTSTSNNFDYWTLKNAEFKTRTGWHGTPCLEFFSTSVNSFAASPGVFLKAGETYKMSFLADASSNRFPNIYINTSQNVGGILIDTVKIAPNDNFNVLKTKTFTVTQDGTYYLIIHHPAAASFIQMQFDNIRIYGNLDVAPLSKLVNPNIIVAQNSTMKLNVNIVSPESRNIDKVEYYANGTLIGSSTTTPFEIAWTNIPIGVFEVVARPFDSEGVSALSIPIKVDARPNMFSMATFFGTNVDDEVRGAVFQKNGTIVLAANIGSNSDYASILLNGADNSKKGCVVRISSDGKSILSITRLAEKLTDIAVDSLDNIYVGGISSGTSGGFFKLNAMANLVLWQKTLTKWVHRLDAGFAGNSVVLTSSSTNFDENTLTNVTCHVYDKNGLAISNFGGASQYTPDVAIDDVSQTIVLLGFKNFNTVSTITDTQSLPVYVPVIRGKDFNGIDKYVCYDWNGDLTSPRFLNRSNNNMADVRTSRASIGKDGKLYVTFEVFGGNHVLRYSPFDVMTTVPIVGGDNYFNFSNTGTETKTFVGRFEPSTGNYILGQQFTARLNTAPYRGNSIFARNGNVTADESGRIYLTGKSAFGLPQTVDYQPGEYTGGAYLLVLSPNMATREVCVRITNGEGRAIAVQNQNRWFYGGSTTNSLYLSNPIQTIQNQNTEAFWGVVDKSPCPENHILGKNYSNHPNKFETSGQINSAHILNLGQNVIYDAQKSIILENGFEAKQGTVFNAYIDGCGNK